MARGKKNPLVFKDCENCGETFSPRYNTRETTRFCCHQCFFAQFRIPLKDKFFKIGFDVQTNGCWHFRGKVVSDGYRYIPHGAKVKVIAHRVSYEIHKGPIPQGMKVCHSCDNPPCCNPDHLWLGTDKDNSDDKIAKGRANVPVGERASNARLLEAQVLEIRSSTLGQTALAKKYCVSKSTIDAVRRRLTWTHI